MNGRKKDDVVTLGQLLDKAHQAGLTAVETVSLQLPDDDNQQTAIFSARVMLGDKGPYMGHGDANPSNVGSFIKPHIIRMAETRAIVRALRWATNVGKAAFEEMGGDEDAPAASTKPAPVDPDLASTKQIQQFAERAERQRKLLDLIDANGFDRVVSGLGYNEPTTTALLNNEFHTIGHLSTMKEILDGIDGEITHLQAERDQAQADQEIPF